MAERLLKEGDKLGVQGPEKGSRETGGLSRANESGQGVGLHPEGTEEAQKW